MIYTKKLKDAIRLSIKTHELDEKQKRKGKDVAYITHPFTVGVILSHAGASEDLVIAGMLHDTVEDSKGENKVTIEMLREKFGETVASLVESVTEGEKFMSWEDRKREAVEHIAHFSHDAVMLKSADTLANITEVLDDYEQEGENIFSIFNASKDKVIKNYIDVTEALLKRWPESPLAGDIQEVKDRLTDLFL